MNIPDPARPSKFGVLVRAGVCLFLSFAGLILVTPLLAPLGYVISAVFSTFAAGAFANVMALRIFERSRLPDIGLYWNSLSSRHLILGFAGGGGAAAMLLGVPLLGGAAHLLPEPDPSAHWGTFFFMTLVLLFGVIGEEILFRGYAFQVLVPVFGEWATILPMGVIFGAAHASNQEVTRLALINTVAWGIVLGYAVLRSGDLWLAIGLHFGWNWTLPLFGVQVSGFRIKVTNYRLEWSLADIWSGGDYGPEGGLLCAFVLAFVIAYLVRAPIVRQRLPLASPPPEAL